jgi:hypothetical protein
MTETALTIADQTNDDSDVFAVEPTTAPSEATTPLPANVPSPEPLAVVPAEARTFSVTWISKEFMRRGSSHCSCGAVLARRDRYAIFGFRGDSVEQLCDACAAGHELASLLDMLNADDRHDYGAFPPILAVTPKFSHSRCAADCPNDIDTEYRVWPIHMFPVNPRRLHTGSCRRCWSKRFPKAMEILEQYLGLAPLPPIAPPPALPPLSNIEIAAQREARNRADLIDVVCAMRPEIWRNSRPLSPGDMADLLIKVIDERVAAAVANRPQSAARKAQ